MKKTFQVNKCCFIWDTICFKTIPAGDIQIKYGCLNYKDLMIVLHFFFDWIVKSISSIIKMVGKLQLPGLPIGFEFAGVDSNGQNVIGFGYKQGHYAKSCRSEDLDFLINVPDDMPYSWFLFLWFKLSRSWRTYGQVKIIYPSESAFFHYRLQVETLTRSEREALTGWNVD